MTDLSNELIPIPLEKAVAVTEYKLVGKAKEMYPILSGVQVVNHKEKNRVAFFEVPSNGNPNPQIAIPEWNDGVYNHIFEVRRSRTKQVAELLGVSMDFIHDNPRILSVFIVAHELGHAKDFLELKESFGESATERFEKTKVEELASLPVPGLNPSELRDKVDELWEKDGEYYKKHMSINSQDKLIEKQEEAYHKIQNEVYADQFATRLMNDLWKELDFPNKSAI